MTLCKIKIFVSKKGVVTLAIIVENILKVYVKWYDSITFYHSSTSN